MTKTEIDETVESWLADLIEEIEENDAQDEPHDYIFEHVDSGWGNFFDAGRIDQWPTNPGGKVLSLLGEVLSYCEEEAGLEDDQGLWEGLQGAQMLASQAFFSLEAVVWEKLRKRNAISA